MRLQTDPANTPQTAPHAFLDTFGGVTFSVAVLPLGACFLPSLAPALVRFKRHVLAAGQQHEVPWPAIESVSVDVVNVCALAVVGLGPETARGDGVPNWAGPWGFRGLGDERHCGAFARPRQASARTGNSTRRKAVVGFRDWLPASGGAGAKGMSYPGPLTTGDGRIRHTPSKRRAAATGRKPHAIAWVRETALRTPYRAPESVPPKSAAAVSCPPRPCKPPMSA